MDWRIKNSEGKTAEEKILEEEGENEVVEYLRSLREQSGDASISTTEAGQTQLEERNGGIHPPPPLPAGMQINIGTIEEADEASAPDPEFRRRIEELAAREDFQSEDGQRELRELVTQAVTGLGAEEAGRSVRRRVD